MPHIASSYFSPVTEDCYFVLANPVGQVVVVKMGTLAGLVAINNLKVGSYFGRLLGSIGGVLTRGGDPAAGGSGGTQAEAAVSLAIHPLLNDLYVFGLCKDHKIRMWSASKCGRIAATAK